MIYQVNLDDVSVGCYSDLMEKMFYESFPDKVFNRNYFKSYWATILETNSGAIWLASDSTKEHSHAGIGCTLSNNPYTGELQCCVLFWKAMKHKRGRFDNLKLFIHLREWAKERGVSMIHAASLFDKDAEKLKVLYETLNFKTLETIHELRL